jgi:hypothetical protein
MQRKNSKSYGETLKAPSEARIIIFLIISNYSKIKQKIGCNVILVFCCKKKGSFLRNRYFIFVKDSKKTQIHQLERCLSKSGIEKFHKLRSR